MSIIMLSNRARMARPFVVMAICVALAGLTGCVAQYQKHLLPTASPAGLPDLSGAVWQLHVEEKIAHKGSPLWHGKLDFGSELAKRLEGLHVPVFRGAGPSHRPADEAWIECTVSQVEEGGLGMRLLRALPSIVSAALLPSWLNTITADVDVVVRDSSGAVIWRKQYRDSYGGVFWALAGPFASPLNKAPDEIIANMATLAANDLISGKAFASVKVTPRLTARATTDPLRLAKIASEDEDAAAREVAVGKLTDQAVLARVALEDKDVKVRSAAVEKITDRSMLMKFAEFDQDKEVRSMALLRIEDQGFLEKIMAKEPDADVRLIAVRNLSSQDILGRLAVEDPNGKVWQAAYLKLANNSAAARARFLKWKSGDTDADDILFIMGEHSPEPLEKLFGPPDKVVEAGEIWVSNKRKIGYKGEEGFEFIGIRPESDGRIQRVYGVFWDSGRINTFSVIK